MSDIKVNIAELYDDFKKVLESLEIPKKEGRLEILMGESAKPNFWDDNENATQVMQEFGDIKKELDEAASLNEEISALSELSQEGDSEELKKDFGMLAKRVAKLKLSSFMSGKYDRRNAIVSIHAGQGGTEAMDWAGNAFSNVCALL